VPHEDDVRQLAYDVAYCQWTLDEMEDGLAWRYVKQIAGMLSNKAQKRRKHSE
jgi:hypothetical protein